MPTLLHKRKRVVGYFVFLLSIILSLTFLSNFFFSDRFFYFCANYINPPDFSIFSLPKRQLLKKYTYLFDMSLLSIGKNFRCLILQFLQILRFCKFIHKLSEFAGEQRTLELSVCPGLNPDRLMKTFP